MPSDTQVIYSMMRVGRIHPPNKQVLRDISLGFYYGAKIGVLGLNGAGKSTLLRIMAGVDKDYVGEIAMSKGYTVGLLEQEPQLDESKTVIEVVREAVQPIVDMLARFDEVNAKFAEPDADFDALVAEQARLQEALDKVDAWNLDSHLELAMDALRCPPADTPVKVLSGGERRRVALTRLLLTEPDILLLDEPTNHLDAESVAWLEHHLRDYKGTVIAVTHDRYFLDNVAGWILELDRGYGIPWKGNYSSWLEQKKEAPAPGGEDRVQAPEDAGARAGVDPHVAQGAPGQGAGARHRLREAALARKSRSAARSWRSTSRPVRAWAISSSSSRASPRATATGCCWRISAPRSRPAPSSA